MKKQLIPAIAMALLGATALGGSTFAWFSANSTASASGLQISAKAAASLLISNDGSSYAASTKLDPINSPTTTVEPVQYKTAVTDQKGINFEKLTDTAKTYVQPDGTIAADKKAFTDTTTDYVKSEVWLLYSGDESSPKVTPTCTLSNSDIKDDIWKAVTVVLVSHDGTQDNIVSTFTFSEGTSSVEGKTKLESTATGTDLSVVSGTALDLDVYVYVDGNDGDCKNSNALNGDSYAVSFSFTIKASV